MVKGVYQFDDGDHYDGEFSENAMHGDGRLQRADGETYDGQWFE